MADHVWSVLCRSSSIDRDSNQVSLLDVLEGMGIVTDDQERLVGQPLPSPMQLVTMWSRSEPRMPETGSAKLTVLAPDEGIVEEHEYDLKELSRASTYRVRYMIPVFVFRGAGLYRFNVEMATGDGWLLVASVPLRVRVDQPPESQTPSES